MTSRERREKGKKRRGKRLWRSMTIKDADADVYTNHRSPSVGVFEYRFLQLGIIRLLGPACRPRRSRRLWWHCYRRFVRKQHFRRSRWRQEEGLTYLRHNNRLVFLSRGRILVFVILSWQCTWLTVATLIHIIREQSVEILLNVYLHASK